MSYFNSDTIDTQEKADFYSSSNLLACANCDSTRGPIETIQTDDGQWLRLCGDCASAERDMEAKADGLCKLPACDARQQIIDGAETTRGLLNALVAHDQACSCATRKPVVPMQGALFTQGVA